MAIPQEVQGHLQLTVEQWLRRNPNPSPQDVQDMTNRLYDMARPETRGNRSDYGRIVNQTINMFNTAEQLMINRDIRGTGLPTSGAIEQGQPKFAYYVIVVGKTIDGEDVISAAVWVRSDQTLTANELHNLAISQVTPWSQEYMDKAHGKRIDHYETFVQLAGQIARS
jgi:hypothetical protein